MVAPTFDEDGLELAITPGTSKYRGVALHQSTGKWQATTQLGSRFTFLGLFPSEQQAAERIREAKLSGGAATCESTSEKRPGTDDSPPVAKRRLIGKQPQPTEDLAQEVAGTLSEAEDVSGHAEVEIATAAPAAAASAAAAAEIPSGNADPPVREKLKRRSSTASSQNTAGSSSSSSSSSNSDEEVTQKNGTVNAVGTSEMTAADLEDEDTLEAAVIKLLADEDPANAEDTELTERAVEQNLEAELDDDILFEDQNDDDVQIEDEDSGRSGAEDEIGDETKEQSDAEPPTSSCEADEHQVDEVAKVQIAQANSDDSDGSASEASSSSSASAEKGISDGTSLLDLVANLGSEQEESESKQAETADIPAADHLQNVAARALEKKIAVDLEKFTDEKKRAARLAQLNKWARTSVPSHTGAKLGSDAVEAVLSRLAKRFKVQQPELAKFEILGGSCSKKS
mmetsp:Transcript_1433/g.2624  ORF Transcript_1433/g.2624 Transcript_1433/m.2624 type:complete len:456 (-) Transcript_1433:59-1426(-)